MQLNNEVIKKLKYVCKSSDEEVGGYITNKNEVIQCENVHPNKYNNFMFSCEDLDKLENESVIATFHTHPKKSANLSKEDYNAFLNWEKLLHFIIGQDKINCYKVSEQGTIVIEPISEVE